MTMSSTNKDSFPSSFLIWVAFSAFSYFTTQAKPSSTELIEMVRTDTLALFLILERRYSIFHQKLFL